MTLYRVLARSFGGPMRPALLLAALPSLLAAQESVTMLKDQKALAVTIYNDNLALVKDTREVRLPKGESRLGPARRLFGAELTDQLSASYQVVARYRTQRTQAPSCTRTLAAHSSPCTRSISLWV